MKRLRYVLCDVFTDRPLAGNALAVFTDARDLETATMQALARELNLSESTFITPPEKGGTVRMRIFTPRQEVPFAGHPTLGTAAVLGSALERDTLVLETLLGNVTVSVRREEGDLTSASFVLPAPGQLPPVEAAAICDALRLGVSAHSMGLYDAGLSHLVVVLEDPQALRQLDPDWARAARLPCDTLDVCAKVGAGIEVRVFAPKHGVPEDPATGSAVGPILWHLHRHGLHLMDQSIVLSQGCAVGRPARLSGRLFQSPDGPAIEVGGQIVVVARGEFRLPDALSTPLSRSIPAPG